MKRTASEIFQKRYFDRKSNRYNSKLIFNQPVHTELEIDYLISKIPQKSKYGLVVDFGSGNGRLTLPLINKGFKVIAIDNSSKSLDELKLNMKKHGLKVNTRSTIRNVKNIKVIAGCDILHHIELKNTLPVFFTALDKNGTVVFSEPGAMNFSWYIYIFLFLDWMAEKKIIQCTYFNLLRQFNKAGFRNIEITGLGLFPRAIFKSKGLCRMNDVLGNLPFLKLFAYRYIVTAKK